ncbi:MAG: isoprenylcysteine carboxylmethyltransferase family protein [Alphaproteobacteria bacterium]|nr:isoprenylcysteine carboxylmethyltransferase family protein [Alphaproteobacteria bacterium]
MLHSKLAIIVVFFLVIFSKTWDDTESPLHDALDLIGYGLITVCALGRVYTSAFLGGFKNAELIHYGPFSVVRNPLYCFSLLGVTGIAFISNHLVIILAVPLFFLWMYHLLVKREEVFLKEKFGQAYIDYMQTTPRFFPKFSLYTAPETVLMSPHFIKKAFGDALSWFVALPIIEFIEYLQTNHIVKPLFTLI